MSAVGALTRYQLALLGRSQRWPAPLLLYAALLAIGVRPGQPLLDGLGLAAALVLPVAAWLVRICVNAEPDAARYVVTAAAGARRAHLAALLAGVAVALVFGCAGLAVVAALSEPRTSAGGAVAPGAAFVAGACALLSCALAGGAVGTLCNRPVVRSRGFAVCATLLGTVLALAFAASPANAAVSDLTRASQGAPLSVPWLPVLTAALLAAAAATIACTMAWRRP